MCKHFLVKYLKCYTMSFNDVLLHYCVLWVLFSIHYCFFYCFRYIFYKLTFCNTQHYDFTTYHDLSRGKSPEDCENMSETLGNCKPWSRWRVFSLFNTLLFRVLHKGTSHCAVRKNSPRNSVALKRRWAQENLVLARTRRVAMTFVKDVLILYLQSGYFEESDS